MKEATPAADKFPCIVDIGVGVSVIVGVGVTASVICTFLPWSAKPVTYSCYDNNHFCILEEEVRS
ncbi:MAG: hypothetical protein WCF03_18330 [Nitrososphaeraceae archaeon]